MKKVLLVLIAVVLISATACQDRAEPESAFSPPGEPTFSVDFKEAPEDWCNSGSQPYGDFYCDGGELQIANKGVGNIALQTVGPFRNFMLEALMHAVGNTGSYGVAFRGQDELAKYYIFRVRPAGQYQFITWAANGAEKVLIPWTEAGAIQRGEAVNVLQIKAEGSQITFYANGQQLASMQDDSYPDGSLGPVATENGHAAVSSFSVWALP